MMSDIQKITQTGTVPAPMDQVWAFLTNDEKMKSWFRADEFIIDVYEGGKIEIPVSFGGEECLVIGEMGLILPPTKIVFTWSERDQFGETWFNNTLVTIELTESMQDTTVTIVHDGFKYLPEETRTAIIQKYVAFWEESDMIGRLQSLIAAQIS